MPREKAWLVAGLGFGDEGKGTIVDYLVRREGAKVVVRYNGGAQAAHRVVLDDGRDHVFAQFGSGTLIPGIRTYLSRFMLVEPSGMINEYNHLKKIGFEDAFRRLMIDERAPLITPFHVSAGRLLEFERGANRNGSCGLGIGEVTEDLRDAPDSTLRVGDLRNLGTFYQKFLNVRQRKLLKVEHLFNKFRYMNSNMAINVKVFESKDVWDWWMNRYGEFTKLATNIVSSLYSGEIFGDDPVIFEGAQGMLLDRERGFYPHVTKTDISYKNAEILLREAGHTGEVAKVGVLRGYFTRHGAGPFVTEDKELTENLQDECGNKENDWQGKMRVGYFDLVAAKYAIDSIGGVDGLAITNLDRLIEMDELKIARGYFPTSIEKDAEALFKWNGPMITGILPGEAKEAVTKALYNAKPVYEGVSNVRNRKEATLYARKVAEELGIKLSIVSFGGAASDKVTI